MKHAIVTGPPVTPEEAARTLGVSARRFRELASLTGYEIKRASRKHSTRKSSAKASALKSVRGK